MLSYILWDVNSDVFTIPYLDHPVRWYGLSWALGFLLGQQIMQYIYKKEGRPSGELDTLTIYVIVAAVAGARLGHVLFYEPLDFLREPWRVFAIWEGGLASHGAAMGVLISLYFFARRTKVKYLWIVDKLVIISALAGSLVRLGNLMNSEVIGVPSDLPWAFVFVQVDNIPRHPAQLYEAISCLLLFILLFSLWLQKRDRLPDGLLTGLFLIILFSLRFVDEFFKTSQVAFEDSMILNMGQILSIPFILAGIIILIVVTRKNMTTEQTFSTDSSHE